MSEGTQGMLGGKAPANRGWVTGRAQVPRLPAPRRKIPSGRVLAMGRVQKLQPGPSLPGRLRTKSWATPATAKPSWPAAQTGRMHPHPPLSLVASSKRQIGCLAAADPGGSDSSISCRWKP